MCNSEWRKVRGSLLQILALLAESISPNCEHVFDFSKRYLLSSDPFIEVEIEERERERERERKRERDR